MHTRSGSTHRSGPGGLHGREDGRPRTRHPLRPV